MLQQIVKRIKRRLIGDPLETESLRFERLSVLRGLAILSSDPISSVAYAGEEILIVLVFVIGAAAYSWLLVVAAAIIGLLGILNFSYRQTVEAYPNGGGAYVVARENIGVKYGLVAGAALLVDYLLTVSVSTTAGTAAITSAFPALLPYRVAITVFMIIILTIGNLRGIRESAKIFSLPTYLFVFTILILVFFGLFKFYVLGVTPQTASVPPVVSGVTLFLLLRAFASGCTALTGVEAVSNAVPVFKEPSRENAKKVLLLLAFLVLLLFGGTSLLANLYRAIPNPQETVISQVAAGVFGRTFFYYLVQATTAMILVLAANTAYAGFPLLASILAQDGYAPRQLTMRGERLVYSNGIVILSALAILLVVVFRGDVHLLIPLYAVGVFMSFTLSQAGMFRRWLRGREGGWRYKAVINGAGAVVTGVVTLIIGVERFARGAWIVFILIPFLVSLMLVVKRHYVSIANQLRLEETGERRVTFQGEHHIIVPVAGLNKAVITSLKYARSLSHNVVAYHVSVDPDYGEKLRQKWEKWVPDIPLIIKESPYRSIIRPLIEFIESEEHASKPNDFITILVPEFIVGKWWHHLLHNQTGFFIRSALVHEKNVAISSVPYRLR